MRHAIHERNPMADNDRAKIGKLFESLRQIDADAEAKRRLVYDEIDRIVSGGEGIGVTLARLKAAWCSVWTARHQEKCTFDHVKHTGFLKKKLAEGFTEDEIVAKIHSYVACEEAFYVSKRHPFALFVTNFQTWRGIQSTQEHSDSAAKLREMRGQP